MWSVLALDLNRSQNFGIVLNEGSISTGLRNPVPELQAGRGM